MDFTELKHFLHLSSSLHFGNTSRACFISPSTLSRSIQRLEDELGYKLFERDNRTVSLTSSGKIFQKYARETLNKYESVINAMSDTQKEISGTLKVFCSVTASYTFMRVLVNRFRDRYPDVHIKLSTGAAADAIKATLSNDVDISMSAKPQKFPSELLFKTVSHNKLVFIVSNERSDLSEITDDTPLVLPNYGVARDIFNRWSKENKLHPNIYSEVSGNEALLSMVSLGCGVGVVPQVVLENSPFKEHLHTINQGRDLGVYEVGVCVTKRKLQTAVVKAFWDIIGDL